MRPIAVSVVCVLVGSQLLSAQIGQLPDVRQSRGTCSIHVRLAADESLDVDFTVTIPRK